MTTTVVCSMQKTACARTLAGLESHILCEVLSVCRVVVQCSALRCGWQGVGCASHGLTQRDANNMETRGPRTLTNQRLTGSMFEGCCAQGSQPYNFVCDSAMFFATIFSWYSKRRLSKKCLCPMSAKFLPTNVVMVLRMPDDVAFSDSIEESWTRFRSCTKKLFVLGNHVPNLHVSLFLCCSDASSSTTFVGVAFSKGQLVFPSATVGSPALVPRLLVFERWPRIPSHVEHLGVGTTS